MKEKILEILYKKKKYRDPDYSAKRLAEDLGLSVFQVSRAIRKEFRSSYSDIILSRRISDAKKHLVNPKKNYLTVDEIGLFVGFANRASFFIAFRKYTGMTPEQYRKEFSK